MLNCSNKSFSSIAQQNSPQVVRKYRATRNFLQVYFLTLSHHANEIKANLHYETHHFGVTTWVYIYLQKTLYIYGFSSKYRVKNKHEFVDSSHQNKQNFEGKKLSGLSGKEFIAFDECVWQIRYSWLGENCTHRFFWPVYRPCFIFPQPPWASAHLIPDFFKIFITRARRTFKR